MPFSLLSSLWLREADARTAPLAVALLGLPTPAGTLEELATAYTDLLLLNVFPYGTVFTDPTAELNAPAAHDAARRYAAHGYQPAALSEVAAPDHLGLGLGFLAHAAAAGDEAAFRAGCRALLPWAPAFCLAVEREPGAPEFYRALAAYTAETLLRNAGYLSGRAPAAALGDDLLERMRAGDSAAGAVSGADGPEVDVRLRDVVAFFLAPARCGVFLSRGRLGKLAREQDLALTFGPRAQVAEHLFGAAGEAGCVPALLGALSAEVRAWADAYQRYSSQYPAWSVVAALWLERTSAALGALDSMQALILSGTAP